MNNKEIAALLNQTRYDQDEPAPLEQVVFRIQFQPIGSLGDFLLFSGRPKSGKTKYASAALTASIFRKEIFQFAIKLPSGKNKVAHFDTEQSKFSHYKMMQMILQLGGADKFPPHFFSYRCRRVAPAHMLQVVEYYLKINPDTGMIMLDGLVDAVESINDEKHCNYIKQWLKRITEDYNVMVIGVIHRGFSSDKSIGHLGSALERTAQTVLVVEANRETKQYILKTEYIRDGEHIAPIAIFYNKAMEQWEETEYIDEEQQPAKMSQRRPGDFDIEQHQDYVREIFKRGTVQPYKDLVENIRQCYAVSLKWAKEAVKHLQHEGLIVYTDKGYTNISQAKLFIHSA